VSCRQRRFTKDHATAVDGDDDDDDDEMMMMIRKDYQRKWYPHPFSSVFLQITRLY